MQPGPGLGFWILSGLAARMGAVEVCWHILFGRVGVDVCWPEPSAGHPRRALWCVYRLTGLLRCLQEVTSTRIRRDDLLGLVSG